MIINNKNKDNEKIIVSQSVNEKIPTVAISEEQAPPEEESKKTPHHTPIGKQIANIFMDFLETIVVALSIFVVVYMFLVQPHEVKGTSMEPTFHNNEYILTDKISFTFVNPARGDVIIFKAPNNPEIDYIKRVIGLPGDTIVLEKGYVYVNGRQIPEPYLAEKTFLTPGSILREGTQIVIPEDDYFVMGDNRPHSSDSREFGPISRNSIVGRAFLRYWPLNVFGLVKHFNYDEENKTPRTLQEK